MEGATSTSPVATRVPEKKNLLIVSGRSGLCRGKLSPNTVSLKLGDQPSFAAWLVQLEDGYSLQEGDSGSLAADPTSGSMVGYVVAVADGEAYLMPMVDMLEQIASPDRVELPSPFDLLAELARHYRLNSSGERSMLAAREALSDSVAKAELLNEKVHVLRKYVQEPADLEAFANLLCWTGARLDIALADSDWAEDNVPIDQGLIRSLLKRLRQSDSDAEKLTGFATLDSGKGKGKFPDPNDVPESQEKPRALAPATWYSAEPMNVTILGHCE